MKKFSTLAFLFGVISGFGQSLPSESHNFVTYDTLVPYVGQPANKWSLRISRPANLFTPGSPDAAPRPAIITMPGIGEVGTDPSYLTRYGPHYWMSNGWDGSVQLGNGVHYPIIITIAEAVNNTSPYFLSNLMDSLKKWFHINPKGVHVAGLSMGAFEWGDLICWSAFPGDEHAMSGVTSYVGLSGEGSTYDANNTGYNTPASMHMGYGRRSMEESSGACRAIWTNAMIGMCGMLWKPRRRVRRILPIRRMAAEHIAAGMTSTIPASMTGNPWRRSQTPIS
jgi:hypothetical protein